MYSFPELNLIFKRCKNLAELEKVCDALLDIIQDGDLPDNKREYAKRQSQIKFRQLII
jgi:uncharacterized protein (UPF0147 family)